MDFVQQNCYASKRDLVRALHYPSPDIARRIWILGASWQSRLDDRSRIHSHRYGASWVPQLNTDLALFLKRQGKARLAAMVSPYFSPWLEMRTRRNMEECI